MASSKIRIAARLRPRIDGDIEDDSVNVLQEGSSSYVTIAHPRDHAQRFKFRFSSSYGQSSTQQEIFENDVKPMIDVVYKGVTVTVFAYGVTSSGKTHTMQGTKSDPGVIPRVVKALFQRKDHVPQHRVSLSVSYVEIYKDEVYDLMVDRDSAPKLPVRENDVGQVVVANLTSHVIASSEEFDRLYATATNRRSTGATNLNRASSRSHAIVTIQVQMVDADAGTTMTGKINLVDLAGSENNRLTGNDPSRMAESAAINKSLSVLGQVVHALNQGASRIPYRDSKLTRILQDALGGSAVGLLICNLAPGLKFRQDTWNTLNFASRTKEIENKPVINVRDTRPAPKPHFAALPPPAPKLAPVHLNALLPSKATNGAPRPSLGQAGPSKLPGPCKGRTSAFGTKMGGTAFQPFAMPREGDGVSGRTGAAPRQSGGITFGMTEEEIDERISKAVEQEVARRLEERERERRVEEEKRNTEQQPQQPTPQESSPEVPQLQPTSMPSGLLTPLLKRHKDLDNELKGRLSELERKYQRENKEAQLADVLSPTSKTKTGRAYVALARAHSEKGDLQVALDLYRKAMSYVPDNDKLRERVLEIEWAVKNDIQFVPEPKRVKSNKAKGKSKGKGRIDADSLGTDVLPRQDDMEQDEGSTDALHPVGDDSPPSERRNKRRSAGLQPLGEATNSAGKRQVERGPDTDDDVETPPKKQKKDRKTVLDVNDGDWVMHAPVKKSKDVAMV